jgi:hypothetical protein
MKYPITILQLSLTAIAYVLLLPAAQAQEITKIADTSNQFSGFSGSPSVNASGTVAFEGYAGSFGVFTGASGTVSTIANFSQISVIAPPVINSSGSVAFQAGPINQGLTFTSAVYLSNVNGTLNTIAQSGNADIQGFSINSTNQVAFTTYRFAFNLPNPQFYAITGPGLNLNNLGSYSSFRSPSINNSGETIFGATLYNGSSGIYSSYNSAVSTIVDTARFAGGFGNPVLNNSGLVAFTASSSSGVGVYATPSTSNNSSSIRTYADTAQGLFTGFGSNVSINDIDQVAFIGNLSNGGKGIYVGNGTLVDKIVAIGDTLFGSTVTDLSLGQYAFADNYLAFSASLADGRQVIALANLQVPEPSAAAGSLLLGSFGIIFRFRRR